MLALFHKCWGKSIRDNWKQDSLDKGVEVAAGRAHVSTAVTCILGGSCCSPAARRHPGQLGTGDEVAAFPRMAFACSLSIIMFNWYWFSTVWSFFLTYSLTLWESRREQSVLFTVLPWSRLCWFRADSRSWIQSSDKLIERIGLIG